MQLVSYRYQKILLGLTFFLGGLYGLVVLYPAYQSGIYLLPHEQIIRQHHPFLTEGATLLILIGVVWLVLIPLLVLNLFTFVWSYRTMPLFQRQGWFGLNVMVLILFWRSYPLMDAVLTAILN